MAINITNTNKGIGVIKILHNVLLCRILQTFYKSFIRPNFIYHQLNDDSLRSKTESVQYNAALAITDTIRGTSQTKIYSELGLQSLRSRWWFRHVCTLYKVKATGLPSYFNMRPKVTNRYQTQNSEDLATYQTRTNYSSNPLRVGIKKFF